MSHEALSPDQFKFVRASSTNPEASTNYHRLHHPEGKKTSLIWHKETGEIFGVQVDPHLQRQGVATAMWNRAHSMAAENPEIVPPRHSRIRSGQGDKWARSVGGELPERDLEKSYRGDE
jgi:GNAT superfamily N-acetyltransferase